jgi:hypothetical protein
VALERSVGDAGYVVRSVADAGDRDGPALSYDEEGWRRRE